MQNTSKPGGLTPITLAVWVCAADKVRLSVSRCTPPPIVSQNIPPASQIVRQTSHVRTTSISYPDVYRWFLGSDSSHMTSLTWRHWLKMKEKKALGKEWAVNQQRTISVHFIDRRGGCVDDFPWILPWFSASLATWSAFQQICRRNLNCYMK